MGLLHCLKETLKGIFPLRLNSTVVALEEDLAAAELELYFSKSREDVLRFDRDGLRVGNAAIIAANIRTNGLLRDAEDHLRHVTQELDALYKSMIPKLSSWPMPAYAHLEGSAFSHNILRVSLPPLRLSFMVSEAVRDGYSAGYISHLAERLASTAYSDVKEAATQELNRALPLNKESNVS